MLRQAVNKHENESALSRTLSQSLFPSSSPTEASQKQQSAKSVSAGFNNALRPSSQSTLNGMRPSPPNNMGGIKRTANGLAKVTNGAFDDGSGSRQKPISVDGASPVKSMAPAITQSDLFDENDFDSDIDLDVEEPITKSTVSYPKLPTAPKPVNPPFKPTQPNLAKHQSASTTDRDSGYVSIEPSTAQAPTSSAPFPWSSSPVEHFTPKASTSHIRQFNYNRQPNTAQAVQNGPPMPAPAPAKRRKLPWEIEQNDQPAEESSLPHKSNASKVKSNGESTPAPKESKSSMYPWNTTASAIKEQQKALRQESKKTVKKGDGDEQSVQKAKTAKQKVPRVFLSEEQQHVLDLVLEQQRSVFFTGSAGTGKSVLLREIISSMRKKYAREPDRVAVTASTGLAACNVGGVTLHSFAGIGLGKEETPELVRKIKKNQKAKHRWMRTKVLIIDEISMVDGDLFDKLEGIARQLRNNGRAFGGIQLIITGDFFQLPPVPDYGKVAKFAFDAGTWNTTIAHTIGLHHVFRQKDPVFAGMLNEMREGRLSEASNKAFRNLSRPLQFEDDFDATELFPTRNEVERANSDRMARLQGKTYPFEARDGGTIVDKAQRDKLLSNCMAAETVVLKKGAQVMLIKNIDESLVNGSIGRVLGFMSEQEFDAYDENDSNSNISNLINGSSSGSTDDPPGPANKVDRAKANLNANISALAGSIRRYPVVRFSISDGTTRDLLCQPESWKVELPNGEVQASRQQIPLILAWALSIHKAQGQTLDRVKVDLGKVFEKGQAYVALSRATTMNGLQVLRFDPRKVNAHEKVRSFYANLSRVELGDKHDEGVKKNGAKKGPGGGGVAAGEYEKNYVDADEWEAMGF